MDNNKTLWLQVTTPSYVKLLSQVLCIYILYSYVLYVCSKRWKTCEKKLLCFEILFDLLSGFRV